MICFFILQLFDIVHPTMKQLQDIMTLMDTGGNALHNRSHSHPLVTYLQSSMSSIRLSAYKYLHKTGLNQCFGQLEVLARLSRPGMHVI